MKKIESDTIEAIGGLYSAIQRAKVVIKPKLGKERSKLGIEIQMIPIIKGKEVRKYRPKSFFVKSGELKKWDWLIREMIRMRWKFAKQEKTYNTEFVEELVGWHLKKFREAIIKGMS